MKRENFFFALALLLFFLFCFLINSYSPNIFGSSNFSFLKVSEVDLLRPLSKEQINQLYLDSNNFLSVFVNLEENKEIVLSEKKSNEVIPIASLSKLMTAVIALENYKPDDLVTISRSALSAYGDAGGLKENEKISINDLLYITLIESNNDGAEALADKMGARISF